MQPKCRCVPQHTKNRQMKNWTTLTRLNKKQRHNNDDEVFKTSCVFILKLFLQSTPLHYSIVVTDLLIGVQDRSIRAIQLGEYWLWQLRIPNEEQHKHKYVTCDTMTEAN